MSLDISIVRYEELSASGDLQRHRLRFTWGKRTKLVGGILRLVQMVVKILLTTPGTDSFAPNLGTAVHGLLRRGVSQRSAAVVKMDISLSIRELERQIRAIQASQVIPDDERLREIGIRKIEYLPVSAEWLIDISVLSEAGEEVSFNLAPYLKGQ